MAHPFALIDAFTSQAFAGNPAVVFLLPHWPGDEQLQLVAREMNQSETAFVVRSSDGFELRWFTPAVEVDLCGHATLASAHHLWEHGEAEPTCDIAFHTRSGVLTARQVDGRIELDFPRITQQSETAPQVLLDAIGKRATYTGRGKFDWLIELASDEEVRAATPNFDLLRTVAARGVMITARSSDHRYDFISRFFAPAAGINEDPVTGSAHCCLAGYWGEKLGKADLRGYQASQRGGEVEMRIVDERVLLQGAAVTVASGQLHDGL